MINRSDPLRVGVVGCGGFGRGAYVNNVPENPDASLVALCDIDPAQAEAAAREVFDKGGREPRPSLYTDYKTMIDQESPDVVMVGTMADVRPRVAIYALNAGAHVLAAKPMAPSLPEAEEMLQTAKEADRILMTIRKADNADFDVLQTAKEADRILMVGYNFRFRDDAQIVHRFIRDGGIGTPRFARAWSFAPSVPIRGPHNEAGSGGGSLARTGVHTMDLAIWFLGNPSLISVHGRALSRFAELPALPPELESLRGNYDDPDLVSGYVQFADGVTLSVESMWLAPPQINDHGVEVWGTQGYASLSPLKLLTWQDGDYVDVTEQVAPGMSDSFHDDWYTRIRREVFHFIDCARGRATPLITPEEMWTDQAIVDGIYARAKT